MKVLLKAQQAMASNGQETEGGNDTTVDDDDDPQVSYMMSAMARMCKLMGASFVPYLPMVMPSVLKVRFITGHELLALISYTRSKFQQS